MYWRITHYTAGGVPAREYTVRARSREAARRKLARALNIPLWTVR